MSSVEAGNSSGTGNSGVPDHLFAPIILVGALLILQPQSILFWMWILGGDSPDLMTDLTAATTSIFLEILALWRWFTPRKGIPVFALLVTCLLLAGPLHRVAYPLWSKNVEESQAAFEKSETIKVLHGEIETIKAQLEAHIRQAETCRVLQGQITDARKKLSSERLALDLVDAEASDDKAAAEAISTRIRRFERELGALSSDAKSCAGLPARMDAVRQQLADRGEQYRQAVGMRETADLNLGRKAVIVLHSLMLIAAQFGSVLAIRALGRVYRARAATKGATPDAASGASMPAANPSSAAGPATTPVALPSSPANSPGPAATTTRTTDRDDLPLETVELISCALVAHLGELKQQNISARTWASVNGYDRREFPLLKKHRELLEAGDRTASMKTIRRLGEHFKLLPSAEPVSQESV